MNGLGLKTLKNKDFWTMLDAIGWSNGARGRTGKKGPETVITATGFC